MNKIKIFLLTFICAFVTFGIAMFAQQEKAKDDRFVSYIADPKKQDVKLYWKDDRQEIFRSIQQLKSWLNKRHQTLEFAMNGGMYKRDNSPQGLYIEQQKILSPLDERNGNGNFYLKPNGVFYITTDLIPVICNTEKFIQNKTMRFATQSGPMLLINSHIHPAFKKGSTNVNIRNGVGILPDHTILFAMSKQEINFYDFANYFKSMGCKNALYLDGFVSRTYSPKDHWIQTDGDFGIIIGVTSKDQGK
jgi:hypothetical protein